MGACLLAQRLFIGCYGFGPIAGVGTACQSREGFPLGKYVAGPAWSTMTDHWSLKCKDAYAQWDGALLTMGTARLRRSWRVVDGLPQACSLQVDGCEWIAAAVAGPSLSPLPGVPGEAPQVQGREMPLGAGRQLALVVDWQVAGQHLRLTAVPGAAAIAVQLWRCHQRQGVAAQGNQGLDLGAEASGVELGDLERWQQQSLPLADRVDGFYPQPQHLRLLQIHFQDRTDLHDELLHEQEWLLHPNESVLALRGALFVLEDVISGACIGFLKEAPLPAVRPAPWPLDLLLLGGSAAYAPGDTAPQAALLRPQVMLYGHGLDAGQWDEHEEEEAVADGYRSWTLSAGSIPELR